MAVAEVFVIVAQCFAGLGMLALGEWCNISGMVRLKPRFFSNTMPR